MNSLEDIMNMIATDAVTPDTHECHLCHRTFSPNADGCPFCGLNAPVTLMPEFQSKD